MQGDYSVPKRWAEDPALGRWVNAERKRKKKLYRGEPSLGMPVAWVAQLDKLGFAWVLRRDSPRSARSLDTEQESEEALESRRSLSGSAEWEPVVIQAQPAPLMLPAPVIGLRQKVEQIRALLEIELPAWRCGPFLRANLGVQPSLFHRTALRTIRREGIL